jgi:single-strand DNA-binding protein
MNFVHFEGNVVAEPEIKTVGAKDSKVAEFRIAVNHYMGQDKQETAFFDVNAWGYQADYCEGVNLSKGDRVVLTGRLQEKTWEDKETGKKRSRFVLVPNRVAKAVKVEAAAAF